MTDDLPPSAERGAGVQNYHACEQGLQTIWSRYWDAAIVWGPQCVRAQARRTSLLESLGTIIEDARQQSVPKLIGDLLAGTVQPVPDETTLAGGRRLTGAIASTYAQHAVRLNYFSVLRNRAVRAMDNHLGVDDVSFAIRAPAWHPLAAGGIARSAIAAAIAIGAADAGDGYGDA